MMLKGPSFSVVLLLVLWGAKVCLATNGRESENSSGISSGEDDTSLSAEERDEHEVAKTLTLAILEICKNGTHCIRRCILGLVRGRSLKPRFAEFAEKVEEWKNELEKYTRIAEGPKIPRGRLWKPSSVRPTNFPSVLELNRHCKRAYDSCISSFRGALDQLCCYMRSEDFFPDFVGSRAEMAECPADLDSLTKSILWKRKDIAEIYSKYVHEASRMTFLAQGMRNNFLEYVERDHEWEDLVDQKKKLLDAWDKSRSEELGELILENRQEINDFMLDYFTRNDKRRWRALVEIVKPMLRYGPLTNSGYIHSFDGFDDLAIRFSGYLKKWHTAESQGDSKTLFEKDLDFSRSLSKKMEFILLENTLNCKGIRAPETDEDDDDDDVFLN